MVTMMPPGSRPGITSFARAPTIRPNKIQPRMPICSSRVGPVQAWGRGRVVRSPLMTSLAVPVSALRHHSDEQERGRLAGADLSRVSTRTSYLASITVSREAPNDVGFREIFVSVDGEQIAMLNYGERITHELPAGPHRLRAHNTLFWKTHDIVLQPGEHARFIAINRAGWGTFGWLILLGAAPLYLTFEREGG